MRSEYRPISIQVSETIDFGTADADSPTPLAPLFVCMTPEIESRPNSFARRCLRL
jgi:hypothetical protein